MEPDLPIGTIHAAIDGSDAAFRLLHRCYSPQVYRAVVSRVRHRPSLNEHVDDLVNEVWAYLIANDRQVLRNWDPALSPFGCYIALISARKVGHLVRRTQSGSVEVPTPDMLCFRDDRDLESSLICRDFITRLWVRVETLLGDVDRQLLDRALLGRERACDVAAALGLSASNAYQRTRRMRIKINTMARSLADERRIGRRTAGLAAVRRGGEAR